MPKDLEGYRPDWHYEAKCFSTGFDNFFDTEGVTFTSSIATVARGRKVCATCPVFTQCLMASLLNREEFGVWAGLSGRQRKKVLARIDSGEVTLEQAVGFIVHQTRGEETDDQGQERDAIEREGSRVAG